MIWGLLIRAVRKQQPKKTSAEQLPSSTPPHTPAPSPSPISIPGHRIFTTVSLPTPIPSQPVNSSMNHQHSPARSQTPTPTATPEPEIVTPQNSIPTLSHTSSQSHIEIKPASPLSIPSPPYNSSVHSLHLSGRGEVSTSQALQIGDNKCGSQDGMVHLAPPRTLYSTKRAQRAQSLLRMKETK